MMKRLFNTVATLFLGLYVRYRGRDAARNRAIKKAMKLHNKTGKRYRVFFLQNRYRAITRDDIQKFKHAGDWGRHVNSTKMEPLSFFDTNLKKTK